MSTATMQELGGLHGAVAKLLSRLIAVESKELDLYETLLEEAAEMDGGGVIIAALSKPDGTKIITAAMKFLADNKVTAPPEVSDEVSELEAQLAEMQKGRRKPKLVSVGGVTHSDAV